MPGTREKGDSGYRVLSAVDAHHPPVGQGVEPVGKGHPVLVDPVDVGQLQRIGKDAVFRLWQDVVAGPGPRDDFPDPEPLQGDGVGGQPVEGVDERLPGTDCQLLLLPALEEGVEQAFVRRLKRLGKSGR